ncbi:restriction endonuclease [Streptomyces jumonjinensis]|uniref:restriction endonuclease n=1 Tax=Streptomyces jumonjinensis TaxID=1945 RepID=UPI0037A938DC
MSRSSTERPAPEHRATVALMVTNARYTKQARVFASKHDITLIDADGLRHLSEYGDSVRGRITPHSGDAP